MGQAEYGVGDSQISFVTGLKTMLGKDALTRSAMAFAKSAEVDPSFVAGPGGALEYGAAPAGNIKLGVALDALRRSARPRRRSDPEVLLARGRVEREVGDGDSALAAFRGYLDRGASRSLGQLEIARTLFLLGRFDGRAALLRGRGLRRPGHGSGLPGRPRHDRLGQRAERVRPPAGRAAGGLPEATSGPTATARSSGPTASGSGSTTAACSTRGRTSSSPRSIGTTTSSSATAPAAATSTTAA